MYHIDKLEKSCELLNYLIWFLQNCIYGKVENKIRFQNVKFS